jgi:hypothetical protein
MKYNLKKIKKFIDKEPLTKERLAKISFYIYIYIFEYYEDGNSYLRPKYKPNKTKFKKRKNMDIINYNNYGHNHGYSLDYYIFKSYICDDIIEIKDASNSDYDMYIYYNIKTNILYCNDYDNEENEIYYDDYTMKFSKNNNIVYLKNNTLYNNEYVYYYKLNNPNNGNTFSSKLRKVRKDNNIYITKYSMEYFEHEEHMKRLEDGTIGEYIDTIEYINSKYNYINKYNFKPLKNIEYYFNYKYIYI